MTAQWLAEHQRVGNLCLLSRSGISQHPAHLAKLQELDVTIHKPCLDASEPLAMFTLLREMRTIGLPPLRGVVHCAAIFTLGTIESQKAFQFLSGANDAMFSDARIYNSMPHFPPNIGLQALHRALQSQTTLMVMVPLSGTLEMLPAMQFLSSSINQFIAQPAPDTDTPMTFL